MKWKKKGLIFCPEGKHGWDVTGFMTPHARLMGDVIRLWGGIRDAKGASRIAWIDVAAENPGEVVAVYDEPALDLGAPGCFDDNGVILGDVIEDGGQLRLYYVGFQHVANVKFYAFTGLAVSDDGGRHFRRYSQAPVMDRSDTGRYGRCIHTVLKERDGYRIYYAIIDDWRVIHGVPYPVYDIWYTFSADGTHIPAVDDCRCVTTSPEEYRIGRPKVYPRADGGYEMFYTRDFVTKEYVIGYARSEDGTDWTRLDGDDKAQLLKSAAGWDAEMACYPVQVRYKDRLYLFYNGNGMGASGVGYAEAEDG
ncbi:MAG: hypothetical protein IJS96_09325 [Schwartzia sp.]|nr:hypothetical protein [Schwartzia sp. (in: firmicutes)]